MDEDRIDWNLGTFAGSRREQLREWCGLTFRQRMCALEELGELARFSFEEKRRQGQPYFDPYTGQLIHPNGSQIST
ncbi:MAG TPA: hypothetical protein VIM61_04200 [Chthoniobacterales bacterium]|jgi:hypothetical protein